MPPTRLDWPTRLSFAAAWVVVCALFVLIFGSAFVMLRAMLDDDYPQAIFYLLLGWTGAQALRMASQD